MFYMRLLLWLLLLTTGAAAQTVTGPCVNNGPKCYLTGGGTISGTWAGSPTFSGATTLSSLTVTGNTTLNGGVLQGSYTGNLQNTGQLIIHNNDATVPWSASIGSGLVVINTQTGNYTGSTGFNRFTATYSGTGPTTAGIGVSTLSVSMAPLAGMSSAELYGLTAGITHALGTQTNTDTGEYVALSAGVTVNDTTRASGGRGVKTYSINTASNVGASGTVHVVNGVHVEQALTGGATVEYRTGFSALAQGNIRGSIGDTAYSVACTPGTVGQCYGNLITLEARPAEPIPGNSQILSTTGSLIAYDVTDACAPNCPMQLAHGINLPNVTFSIDIMNFKNWQVKGDGRTFASTANFSGASATGAGGTLTLGATFVAAGASGCPTGVVGGASIQGCLTIGAGGVLRNIALFPST